MCANHTCATCPTAAPTIGQLGRALQTACLWALPMAARGQLGWCLVAHLVSGAAVCPGCAFAPVPAGSALLSHTHPRASTRDLTGSVRLPCPFVVKMLGRSSSAFPFSTLLGLLWEQIGVTGFVPIKESCVPAHKERTSCRSSENTLPSKVSPTFSRPVPRVYPGGLKEGGPPGSPYLASGGFPEARD